jgi:serine/threonine protein kinase
MLAASTQLHDRYRILRSIGSGGMGAVYEAVDLRLRNTVAVKQLSLGGEAADRAFEREAQLLAGLRHAILPVVIDYFADQGDRYLVMQYIEGEDFARYLERLQAPCPPDEVVTVANAVLTALAYLHAQTPPIIHRDIKPANLKRTPTGDVVLLDFGLAKGRLDTDPTTVPADDKSSYGFTLKYAPPEQIDGRPTDARSDLFALGATLYHLAVGTAPPSALERMLCVTNGSADPLVAANIANPAVGAVLGATITRALQLDPAQRFASAGEMRFVMSTLTAPGVPRAEPTTAERRVDAALPTHVEVGRQTDLLVQVRFADSPLLGIEDWPTARRPEQVEQQSEPLQVTHLVDDATGRLMPARVRIRIVASDFTIEGEAERLVEVPVDDYSKRMAFLLTPHRAGYCRVNVEVYALDELFLGTVAVEAEAVSTQVAEPVPNVAHLVLGSFAQQKSAPPKPAPTAVSTTADTVRIKITPELAAALAERAAATPPPGEPAKTDALVTPPQTAASRVEAQPVETAAPTQMVAAAPPPPPPIPIPAAAPAASARVPATPRDARATPKASASPPAPRATPKASEPPVPRASMSSRLPIIGSAAAAILIAGLVFTAWPKFSGSVSAPPADTSFTPAPTASAPVPTPATSTAPATPSPASTPPAAETPAAFARPGATAPVPGNAPRPAVPAPSMPAPASEVPRPAPVAAPQPPPPSAAPPPAPPSTPAPPSAAPPPAPPSTAALPTAAPPTATSPTAAPPTAPPPTATSPTATSPPAPPPTAPPASAAPPVAAPSAPAPSAAAPSAGRSNAAQILEAARKLEESGELAQALHEYERARQLVELDVARLNEAFRGGLVTRARVDAVEATLNEATQAIARLRSRAKREGDAAFAKARQFDAQGRRDDAIKGYEQAVKLLPDDDANAKTAKDRLDALRGRQ